MDISVIVPSYNEEKYIEKSLKSIINQKNILQKAIKNKIYKCIR